MTTESKCLPRIPFPAWARDAGLEGGEKDYANWNYLRVWAQQLLSGDCVSSGCCCFTSIFSLAGTVTGGLASAPNTIEHPGTFDRVKIGLRATSSDDITVSIWRYNSAGGGDTQLDSFTIDAGDRFYAETFSTLIEQHDTEFLYATVDSADGADGVGLTVTLYGSCADVDPHSGGGGA